ncbi:hypothetical protein [Ktedonospora formicarum]|uniref:Baseplate protein J-like domain-containing protein n=1 Tax=Ktedonospora formicarum TaxID=2778364 RepID=A0A8J3HTC9_9CHLR|nr:hypothetical protein [Ktedonospora formicarum]GHO42906.1 hypothetical protein KSX_10690 [Ktedonospora formicarum]
MRQGNGSDVLGVNDPRSQKIGMIYVSPNDEHKNVLTAILTQEKVGRERIAIILPAQNKAFQRPTDFDGLKSLRKKLRAQLIFVAPSGSPPANFARQRNFTVFSSLEGFTQSLEEGSEVVASTAASNRNGGFFGLFKKGEKKNPKPVQEPQAPEPVEEEPREPDSGNGKRKSQEINPVLLGGAATASTSLAGRPRPRIVESQPPQTEEVEQASNSDRVTPPPSESTPNPGSFNPDFDDDGDLLAPPTPEQMDEELGIRRADNISPEDLETIEMPLEADAPRPTNTRRTTGKNARGKSQRPARNLNADTPAPRRNTGKTAKDKPTQAPPPDKTEESKGPGLASLGLAAAAGAGAGALATRTAQNTKVGGPEPEPIELQPVNKTRRRTTVNLNSSAPEAAEKAASLTRSKRPSGKIGRNDSDLSRDRNHGAGFVAGAAAGALAGSALAQEETGTRNGNPLKRNTGKTAAVGAGTGVSTLPPNNNGGGRSTTRGGRSSGGGTPPPTKRQRRRGWPWIVAAIIVLLLLLCAGTVYAQPALVGQVRNAITGQQPVTITLTPDNRLEKNSYIITGVKENPDPAKLQISARQISTSLQSGNETAQGTGRKQTEGVRSSGNLTFSNGSSSSFTVASGTAITTNGGGLTVVTDVPAVIPAYNTSTNQGGQVTIRAHAANPGANGNIGSQAVNKNCCASGNFVFVKNTNAFTGGQDPQNYSFVTQQDVNKVSDKLKTRTAQTALTKLRGQMQNGEEMAGNPQCTPKVNSSQPIGDTGENIPSTNISVSVTCTAQVYNKQQLQDLVSSKLQVKADTDLGNGYKLVGKIQPRTIQQRQAGENISWLMEAQGIWVYQISTTMEQDLAKRIAGKSVNEAKTILESTKGIGKVNIQTSGDTLPGDTGEITFTIQNIQGLGDLPPGQGTPTLTAPTTTPQEGNG